MRLMYDADNPYDIPRDAKMVAGYVDGPRTTWKPEWWDRFPDAVKVTISAVGVRWDADVFDVEPGCIWPPENVIPLVNRAREAGRNPTVYCNQKNHWRAIRDMFEHAGMAQPPYWVANYDNGALVPVGAVAKQFAHPPQTKKHFDLSVVADFWPGVDREVVEDVEMGYSFNQVHLPATEQFDRREVDVVIPWQNGATGVQEVWVTLFSPGQPFITPPDGQRHDATIDYAHWVDGDGNIVGHFVPDGTILGHHQNTGGVEAPNTATKLTVVYSSVVGLNAGVEVKSA